MKKYQLWLERKTYSQHLANLMRIKATHSERRLPTRILPPREKPSPARAQTVDKSSQLLSPRDISYIISARQLKNHKLRLVKTNEIVRENKELVKRLNQAKPFVSNKRPVDKSNYKLKRKRQRANEQMNYSLKDKKYRQFQQSMTEYFPSQGRHKITLQIQDLPLRLNGAHHTSEISLELLTPFSSEKCKPVSPQQIMSEPQHFTLPEEPPETMVLRVHHWRNLSHDVVGDFMVRKPKQGQTVQAEWENNKGRGEVVGRVTYHRVGNRPKLVSPKMV